MLIILDLRIANSIILLRKELNNGFGGIITIRTGSKEKAFKFINALQIPLNVSNIGDTKTLVIHPSSTISAHSTEEEKKDCWCI